MLNPIPLFRDMPPTSTMYKSTYSISPGVRKDGSRVWRLYRLVATPFGGSRTLQAINSERSVLERAKDHLEGKTE